MKIRQSRLGELVSSSYVPRSKMYFDSLREALDKGTAPKQIDWYAFGNTWSGSTTQFPPEPTGDTYAASMAIAKVLDL